ncbi:MAG: hypothetical protein HY329_18240 [Chloroflexi bacterium]|nr:hypothetical protein [Chloroflexota bacterium]
MADLLRTTEAELPRRLKEVGQELAFHCAVNRELYQQIEAALTTKKASFSGLSEVHAIVEPGVAIESAREELLAAGVSGPLQNRLAAPN